MKCQDKTTAKDLAHSVKNNLAFFRKKKSGKGNFLPSPPAEGAPDTSNSISIILLKY